MISFLPALRSASDRGRLAAAALAALFGMALPPAPSAAGDLYGLVIGINEYQAPLPSLDGAVNDADDVADALRQRKARRVWLLKNREATRDRILAAWGELVAQAKPGDFVLVHIAGHGARSAEKVAGTGTDGLDEFFVLADFAPQGAGTRERIINKEWGGLLRQVPNLKVMFVADTCHSGSMTRSYSPRRLRTRVAGPRPLQIRDDALPPPDPAGWVVTPDQIAHVVFFGAVGQDELDPEVLIDQRPRGALSWAVANGLRGGADLDRNGVVGKEELVRYVKDSVVTVTEGEQHPRIVPGQIDLALQVSAMLAARPEQMPLPILSLEILAPTPEAARDLTGRLRGVSQAAANAPSDLTWDVVQGQVRNQFQDVLLFPSAPGAPPSSPAEATRDYKRAAPKAAADPALDVARVQAAVDKKATAQWLAALATRQPLGLSLLPKDVVQHAGGSATLRIDELAHPYLTVINLGPTGNVNLIYPVEGDPAERPKGQPYSLDLTSEAPFGSEHFIAFNSPQPLTALNKGLAAIDGQPNLEALRRLVAEAVQHGTVQVGIHAVFTAP